MTDKYEPSEELKDYINDCPIQSYRLVDGSYVIAEEVDHDVDTNVLYIAGALSFEFGNRGKGFLRPWLDTQDDDLIQLVGDKIVGRSDTPFELKLHYHRYFVMDKLKNILTPNEIDTVIEEMFKPPVDKLDSSEDSDEMEEGESWKVDNGIDDSPGLKEDTGFKSPIDIHMEWRRKHKNNRED
jgi:hypothetical protein